MRKKSSSMFVDRLHKGVVYTCIGLTLYGSVLIGQRVYRYFTVVRPQRKLEEMKMIEEGAHDKAPILKA